MFCEECGALRGLLEADGWRRGDAESLLDSANELDLGGEPAEEVLEEYIFQAGSEDLFGYRTRGARK